VAIWAMAASVYGGVMVAAAMTQPISRRAVAFVAALAYTLLASGAGTLASSLWINLVAPGALLLSGYWLSGFFFRDPQPGLERWLLRIDRALRAELWMLRLPRAVVGILELSYALAYVVVAGGAIYTAVFGVEAVAYYWSLVLTAELASFAPLPWLRSRPPRALEPLEGTPDGIFRRLNKTILNHASVQANTLPSGHVSGAVAGAFGVLAIDPVAGTGLLAMAGIIAIAAIAGRYHYVVDCAAGAAVAATAWSLM
jgi:hypothetical protein